MALESFMLEAITGLGMLPNNRVLCLGYPDIFCAPGEWPKVERAKDQDAINAWHHSTGDVLDAASWFKHLGLDLECWDITQARGTERVMDLNDLWIADRNAEMMLYPPSLHHFGLIIDPGTSEHIFNIGGLFRALAELTSIGGAVMHANPLNMANHGMWSINPTAYFDFYEANGFQITKAMMLSGPLTARTLQRIPKYERFDAAENSSMFVMARKMQTTDLVWPTQAKYRINPMLKGAA